MASVPLQILPAEDNPGDVRLIREAFREHNLLCQLHVVSDGEKAMGFLNSLYDAPKGIKEMPQIRQVPVMVLSSSDSPTDRIESERLGAHCFVSKPSNLDEFMRIGAMAKELAPQR